jgi:hypothetical protein
MKWRKKMLTTQARWLRNMKRSKQQILRDKFILEEDHKYFGPNYTEDSKEAWILFQEKNNQEEK